ncbi:MAG: hypothetical protein WCC17_10335 [Candidatus Nitrosopolaris sp.]
MTSMVKIDRDSKRSGMVSDSEDIGLICSLILLEREIGHRVTIEDLNNNFDAAQISDLMHVVPFLIEEKLRDN